MKKQIIYGIMALVSPAAFWATDLYVGRYDGWGQWAAAPILLVPLGYSLIVSIYGCGLIYSSLRKGDIDFSWPLLTLVALSPWIYTLLR